MRKIGRILMREKEKAAKLAEFIRKLPDFIIVNEIDGNYQHLGATVADAILQANMKYETHVRPRIKKNKKKFPFGSNSIRFEENS
jgi:hypothetical protein